MKLIVSGTGSSGNTYTLISGEEKLILDAGVPIKQVKRDLGFDVRNIKGVLITHTHKDHSAYAKDYERMGIPVWKPYESEEPSLHKNFGKFSVRSIPLKSPDEWCHTNSDGTSCPIYAYIIMVDGHRILYMTDFLYSPYTFKSFKLTDMLIEAHHDVSELDPEAPNYYHTILGHPDISTTKEIVRINQTEDLKFICLCHCSGVANKLQLLSNVKEIVNNGVTVEVASKGKIFYLDKVANKRQQGENE